MNIVNISPEAREAAGMEILNASAKELSDEPEIFKGQGRFVQLAINSAVGEKDKEIERLKLLCADHATSQAIAESEVVQMGYKCAGMKVERDTLIKQLAELREIAEGLSERIKRTVCDSDDESHAALTRYTQWKESQKCTFCNGTGKVDSHNDTCPDCDGKGKQ